MSINAHTVGASTGYRPDIDGLRAVAVLSVFLYHLNIPGFGGGYVGVDVFFVISGFLITRILLTEYRTTGRIDYRAFYLRRIRRIIPALIAVLVLTTLTSIIFLSPTQLIAYGQSLIATVASVSNIWFGATSGYFDGDATQKPLLHTWSLGVEEQFYFIWPVCIALLARVTQVRSWHFGMIVVGATIMSEYWLGFDPTTTFFGMPFRVGEFAIGALVFVLQPIAPRVRWLAPLLYSAGLLCIAAVVVLYRDTTVFPGINALIPCVAAGICIWSAPDAGPLTRILSNRVMVTIGLLSYVIYLVHWPVIVLAPYVRGFRPATDWDSVAILVVTLAVAAAIHIVVERPLRAAAYPLRRVLQYVATLSIVLAASGVAMWVNDGFLWRSWVVRGTLTPAMIAKGKNDRFQINALMCEKRQLDCSPPTDGKPRIIIETPVPEEQSVLIIGDSHAVDAMNALHAVFPTDALYLSQLGACPPIRDVTRIVGKNFANLVECNALNEKRYDVAYLRQFDYLAINILYVRYTVADLADYLDFLHRNGIQRVIVFGDFVTLTRDLSDIVSSAGYAPLAIEAFREQTPVLDAEIRREVVKFGYFYISKYDVFCPARQCQWMNAQDVPFTYDMSHLSYPYAAALAIPYADALHAYVGH